MFLDFFHLHEQPFGVTPDPAYLYPSRTHCEALDALTDGILGGRGFLALIAEPGMGKTTLLYQVLDALRDKARTAFLFQTQCNSREFFQYLLSELGVDSTGMGLVTMHTKLNEMLFADLLGGKRFVLIVDEAQNLDDSVLETIRLLSNFETSHTKLLQIVLAGQPQLGEKLGQKHLSQLLQRIAVVQHLEAFSPEETAGYIRHRLKVAGNGEQIFEPDALAFIANRSGGVPRIINKLCFQCLLEAHAEGRRTVSVEIAERAHRKLNVAPGAGQAPSPPLTDPDSMQSAASHGTQPITYKPVTGGKSRSWHLWMGAFLAILLTAGLALAGSVPKKMMRTMSVRVKANFNSFFGGETRAIAGRNDASKIAAFTKSGARTEEVDDPLQTHGAQDLSPGGRAFEPPAGVPGTPDVTGIQVMSTQNDARVVVMLDDAVQYNSARISAPERIYFDLHNARLDPSVVQKTVPAGDGLLKWVRAAQNTDDVVRLVLDADKAKAYSAQLLRDPYRLVIDVHAQSTSGGSSAAGQGSVANSALADAAQESRPSLTQELGLKISRIAIDPGHGGFDTGAMGPHGLMEKSLCLDVALRLGQLIEQNIPGAQVIYTRTTDKYVSLEDRTAIANRAHADLFISIHANSSDSPSARGVETYYLSLLASPASMRLAKRENALAQSSLNDLPELIQMITRNAKIDESKQLAVDLQNSLAQRLQLVSRGETNRGVKRAPFIVLTGASMPAVLSEISFISNASDESLLLESSQRQRVAESLCRGIETYLDSLNSLPRRKQLLSENRLSASPGPESQATGR
ncbi:MAG TPA: N-acetylmuramoyl-L-alanine amidase [Candidatus Baltobacteraceae bacterium]|nr:N-acetylmuramoyl-L-alanine amidase [Candidatus Baltobacteraceae bacterium]